jgi:hypothetical protein
VRRAREELLVLADFVVCADDHDAGFECALRAVVVDDYATPPERR